jgi:hypothetical protein
VQQVVRADAADAVERERRSFNVRVKGLADGAEESPDALHDQVCKLLTPLQAGEAEFKATRVIARAAPATGAASKSVLVQFQSKEVAAKVLATKHKLRSTQFERVFIDEDLTPLQLQHKRDAMPMFLAAKRQGERVRWEGGVILARKGAQWVPY